MAIGMLVIKNADLRNYVEEKLIKFVFSPFYDVAAFRSLTRRNALTSL